MLEVGAEGFFVGGFEAFDAVVDDVPVEDFFVDVGEEDAAGEFGHVGVFLDEGAGVEADGFLEVFGGDFGADGAAEFALEDVFAEGEVEADGGELDALLELLSVPKVGLAVAGDGDEGFLVGVFFGGAFEFAHAGAVVAVADVVGGDFEVALAHEFFLHEVLHVFDVDEGFFAFADAGGDGAGDVVGAGGVFFEGEEGARGGGFDFGFGPGDDVAVATNEAHGHGVGLFFEGDFAVVLEAALEDEGFGDVVGVVLDEGFFDEKVEVVLGELEGVAFLDLLHEVLGDAVGDGGDEGAVFVVEDGVVVALAGDEEVGEGFANGVGDVGEGELFFGGAVGDGDLGDGVAFGGEKGFAPVVGGEVGVGVVEAVTDDFFEGDVFFEGD